MSRTIVYFFYLCLGLIAQMQTAAQSYTLEPIQQNQFRNQQLLGIYDSITSFCVQNNSIVPEQKANWKKPTISLLPFVLAQQFNTHHPFGWNDGAMIQAKGYQVLMRPGANIKYGIFEAQVAPEFVFASNTNYPTNALYGNPNNHSYNQILPGQSFVKVGLGPIAIGISTQNLWWGPGIYSSLLMSNNAPGFFHAFIGSRKPIKTPIGNIEFNLIGAKLNSNKAFNYENNHLRPQNIQDNWRYMNAYAISWNPKWVKGFFLGMTRAIQEYGTPAFNRNISFLGKYIPAVISPTQKKNNMFDDTLGRDQLASFFMRWVLAKARAEFYVEFGKNDYGINLRDYLNGPTHSAAYTVGFRKLIATTALKQIQLEAELTHLSQSPDYLVRSAGNWYEHGQVLQGYTQNNQILGAGAGFGSNVQTITATWINGNIRNGFLMQRIERDPIDRAVKWTDFSMGWMPQWEYKNLLFSAKIQWILSNNYSWEKNKNPINLHSRLMVQYNFK
ncbi:MAG: hypothetical protein EAZ13_01950 [Sphingobacteriia bacterium]|nr:MAG: hypothetical protein EAZ13_01950 [Sphingobacteriia bacterium]